ncbi:BatD family protein [Aestuariibacter halophilus]|uniref:BatD family protein n=1 Tax=Fluctibacter halophilus TaxID=226011 RepID=A0ABS8G3J3_9ALTE|nr:BatD family protein [Aestuariibacter halophilus]MCC2615162.1 BatD family protein [Aestuariibacter halophilus]
MIAQRMLPLIVLMMSMTVVGNALASVTEVTATVDKNPAMIDESITLTVTANGDADRDAFDPSPLLNDFVVGRTSVSSQTQIINFDTQRSTTWRTILIPRKEGRYTIPSFEIEGQKTQPINVMIVPVSANQAAKGRDLFVTTSVENNSVYLQQQIHYTVRLHIAQDLQRGNLSEPQMQGADVRQVGKDREFSDLIDGRRYRIIERTFAIIPQQSGTFTINGPLFEGEIIDNAQRSFGFFNRTKTVNRVGPAIDVTVKPIPNDVTGHWLPSAAVQLHEEWQPQNTVYRVGDPITRTLTLTAEGLVEEQLPAIESHYPDSVKTYPDQATTATVERANTLIAQRVENIALIASQPGTITLPEVTVPWFNVVTEQTEYATLPARTLTIEPALVDNNTPALPGIDVTAPAQQAPAQPDNAASPHTAVPPAPQWWSVSSWALLALWLVTLFAWRVHATKRPTAVAKENKTTVQVSQPNLSKALANNDIEHIIPALTEHLAQLTGQPQQSLPQSLQRLGHAGLQQAVNDMLASRYGNAPQQWQSATLQKHLNDVQQQISAKTQPHSGLRPLHLIQ